MTEGLDSITTAARRRLDALAKPPGSLGRLEDLAVRLAATQGTLRPRTHPRRLVIFAGDHGVVASGASAWPSSVTQAMLALIASGRAASSVLARTTETELHLVDVGSFGPHGREVPWRDRRVRAGTRDLSVEPALTLAELQAAWDVGADEASRAAADGMQVVAGGEMGIGNTTPAACLTALLADVDPDQATGPGAGADDEALARKRALVRRGVERERPGLAADPRGAIAGVAGLEIAALAGFFASAAAHGLTVVLDGFVATAAALVAERLAPGARNALIAAHRSAEPGHAAALAALGLVPLLEWEMRLGEGTGALALMPALDAAAAILTEMALLADLSIAPDASPGT